jgi:hypothetical protein
VEKDEPLRPEMMIAWQQAALAAMEALGRVMWRNK